MRRFPRRRQLLTAGLVAAVPVASAGSVHRPVPVAQDATSLRAYLADHPVGNMRVTDRAGHRYWIDAPEVRGDSLVGRHGYDQPGRPVGVGIDQMVSLQTGHFSAGRTTAVVGGVLAAAGVAILLVADEAQPIY
jgi:hypothetical protein